MCTRARICTWGFHFAHLLTCSRRLCSDQNVVSAPERSYLSWRSTSRLLSTSVKALENDLLSSLLRSTWSGSVQSGFVMRNSTSFFSARASDVSVFYSLFCNTAVYFLAFCLHDVRARCGTVVVQCAAHSPHVLLQISSPRSRVDVKIWFPLPTLTQLCTHATPVCLQLAE